MLDLHGADADDRRLRPLMIPSSSAASSTVAASSRNSRPPARWPAHFVKLIYFGGIIDQCRHARSRSRGCCGCGVDDRHDAGARISRMTDAQFRTWAGR